MDALRQGTHYTYADYLTWSDDVRYELIDGAPYLMAPPNRRHQEISWELSGQLHNFLKGKPCKAYAAPFGVRLNADAGDDTVVLPDILVVCDKSKLDDKGCVGAPDMVIEILSPSSFARDKVLKFNKYLGAGVREYWVVYPDSKTVSVYVLENGKYTASEYADTDTVPVHVLDGLSIDLKEVFAES